MNTNTCFAAALAAALIGGRAFAQGGLTPPGAPAPAMLTLYQVAQQAESRTAITSLPYFVVSPGSYYLVTNLVGTSGQSGITIKTNSVTLDLNGFELLGVAGSYAGIDFFPAYQYDATIMNGTVRNWGHGGLYGSNAKGCLFAGIKAYSNDTAHVGRPGILAGENTVVRDCVSSGNYNEGFYAFNGCVIRDCTAFGNGGYGFSVRGSVVSGCTASDNLSDGVYAYSASTVVGCVARGNASHGIEVVQNCLVARNLCDSNGANAPSGAGVFIGSTGNRIEENTATGNDLGFNVTSSGNLVIRNSARGNVTNYTGTAFGVANILQVGSAMYFTDSQPWANFSY